jgi:DNA-binding MarR family transcriptional regulator
VTVAPQRQPQHSDTSQPSVELLAPFAVESWCTKADSSGSMDALLLAFQLQGRLVGLLSAQGCAFELTATEALALVVVGREPTPVSHIARAVGIRPNGASVLVDRLKERRLVRRQRSRRDNRVVRVDVTDAGRATVLANRVADPQHPRSDPWGRKSARRSSHR